MTQFALCANCTSSADLVQFNLADRTLRTYNIMKFDICDIFFSES